MRLLLDLELNEKALSVNQMYSISGASKKGERHKFLSKEAKEYEDKIIEKIFVTEIVDYPVKVEIEIHKKSKRQFDIDNCAKAILDAVTKSGFWEDDNLVYELNMKKFIGDTDKIIIKIYQI